jgi:hypothetical protein
VVEAVFLKDLSKARFSVINVNVSLLVSKTFSFFMFTGKYVTLGFVFDVFEAFSKANWLMYSLSTLLTSP